MIKLLTGLALCLTLTACDAAPGETWAFKTGERLFKDRLPDNAEVHEFKIKTNLVGQAGYSQVITFSANVTLPTGMNTTCLKKSSDFFSLGNVDCTFCGVVVLNLM